MMVVADVSGKPQFQRR